MAVLTLKLAPETYRRLREEAVRLGKSPQVVAEEWLAERLVPPTPVLDSERERTRQAFRAAGLLTALGPNLRRMADPAVCLEDVSAALGRAGGKTFSEIVLEQRGSRG